MRPFVSHQSSLGPQMYLFCLDIVQPLSVLNKQMDGARSYYVKLVGI